MRFSNDDACRLIWRGSASNLNPLQQIPQHLSPTPPKTLERPSCVDEARWRAHRRCRCCAGCSPRRGGYLFDGIRILRGEDGTVISDDGKPILQYVWGKYWVNNHARILKASSIYRRSPSSTAGGGRSNRLDGLLGWGTRHPDSQPGLADHPTSPCRAGHHRQGSG